MIPPIASRFVAGESPATALDQTRRLNDDNIGAIINLLGEHHTDRQLVVADTAIYLQLIEDIAGSNFTACISVKPSQLGLDIGEAVFRRQLETVVDHAVERDVFVWIDMEDHTTTDATLDAYENLARTHGGGVGLCLQANLRRTRADLRRLATVPGSIRLVKGAYDEPSDVARQSKAAVDEAYRDLLEYAFAHFEGRVAVGSHDPAMIDYAIDLHAEYGADFEIQMLMGVREDAQRELTADYDVWQYVPYGDRWASYFTRRVLERKENLGFALRAIVGR